jgi:hypothetical protein
MLDELLQKDPAVRKRIFPKSTEKKRTSKTLALVSEN